MIEKSDPEGLGLGRDRLSRLDHYFARYVESGRLPGYAVLIGRRGEVGHFAACGLRNPRNGAPIESDTLFRIFSMTKPVTSVAAMMLFEEGRFDLSDPVSRFLPEFENLTVFAGGSSLAPALRPAGEPMRIWHLLTHTAGLTYGFNYNHPVDALYRAVGFEWRAPEGADLSECCRLWSSLPLLFEPGSAWNYSHATDVLGRLIEVVAGEPLDDFLSSRIFRPLGMADTSFQVRDDARERLASLCMPDVHSGKAVVSERMSRFGREPPQVLWGGAGLVSSIGDYFRFASMLLNGGEGEGTRLLSPHTVRYMTTNQLPGDADMLRFGQPTPTDTEPGVGFGLGFSVVTNEVDARLPMSRGEYGWGGAASTVFWVDPAEELVVIFMTQLFPSGTYPLGRQLRQLVYQALVG